MSKYKFDLVPEVKNIIEWQLEHYHEYKKQLEQYKNDMIPSPTASYSLAGGTSGGSTSNPTENIGLRMATNQYILFTEQSIRAITRTLERLDKTDLDLIDLVYWKRGYNISGAGLKVGLSVSKSYQHINTILGLIALEMGYVNI